MTIENHKQKVIVIYGATASGKSSFALDLASQTNGVIINADSMQVYKDLQILTARPNLSNVDIPHKLYGFLNGDEPCSAGIWSKLAADEIKLCFDNDKTAIIVGGTGLYIESLTKGLAVIPEVSPDIKEKYRCSSLCTLELYNALEKVDNEISKKINRNDRQRITRALEVFESTGKSLSFWQKQPPEKQINADFINIFINPDRKFLYQNCDTRFDEMIKNGAIDEVKTLMEKNYPENSNIAKALGVKEISSYLKQEISLNEACEKAKTSTRQYAKRQITWFKNRFVSKLVINNKNQKIDINKIIAD